MKTKRKGKLCLEKMYASSDFFQEDHSNCPVSLSIDQDYDYGSLMIEQHQYDPVTPDEFSTRTSVNIQDEDVIDNLQDQAYRQDMDNFEQEEGQQLCHEGSDEEDW
jgi:hypothetical protein